MFQTLLGKDLGSQVQCVINLLIGGLWRVEPHDILNAPSNQSCYVIMLYFWDSELPTKLKMRLVTVSSLGPVSKEDDGVKPFQTLGSRL